VPPDGVSGKKPLEITIYDVMMQADVSITKIRGYSDGTDSPGAISGDVFVRGGAGNIYQSRVSVLW
jgi:hypothetical protein